MLRSHPTQATRPRPLELVYGGAPAKPASALLAEQRMLTHADRLEVLPEHLVEVVGYLLGRPAALPPHRGDLPGRLEQRVGVARAAQDLTVDVGGTLGGQERDERRVERGVLVGRRVAARVEPLGHAREAGRGDRVDRD